MAEGLNEDQTEQLFGDYVNTALLSDPDIRRGASSVLDAATGTVSKEAVAHAMHPRLLSQLVVRTLHEGKSAGAQEMRRYHPDHVALTEEFSKNASALQTGNQPSQQDLVSAFEAMPLSKKLAIITALGSGMGATSAVMSPRNDEQDLSKLQRGLRGAGRGAIVGAGGLLGAEASADLAEQFNPTQSLLGARDPHWVAQAAGAAAGGVGASHLAEKVLNG